MIVIHHTGSKGDWSAAQIHGWHLDNGWSGVGYHFIIRKNGTIERGRPQWAIGSHAYGFNSRSIGIHLSGDFNAEMPTQAQINSCAALVKYLADYYRLTIHGGTVKGHCDLMATDCPGKYLYGRLSEIIDRAQTPPPDVCYPPGHVAQTNPYGLYNFDHETIDEFVKWLLKHPVPEFAKYGTYLTTGKDFDADWIHIATVDPGHFAQLQSESHNH